MKRFLKGLAIVGSLVLGFVLFVVNTSVVLDFFFWRDVAGKVTAARIRRVQPGMSMRQVVHILGRPYTMLSEEGSETYNLSMRSTNKQGANETDTLDIEAWMRQATADSAVHSSSVGSTPAHDRSTTFTYTRPVAWAGRYPMLWVHFDSSAHVSSVYAKVYRPYSVLDDEVIYSLSPPSEWNSNLDHLESTFD
ncbi:outer membrane protein assembly factor BamE domain-containing protein [Hymenobacter cellulosilyticus]|uniref:Outer membrane protein assembly factor BamE n=1 Tax=Hymenobacter cellulosilyticus TaxID=2932248 RepID=A0A8T9Q2K4_9BACT|nr:outer membrane protein assembly factor BamE [Hymenobacter cellulosilyticus]UOQ71956.1 outer membrane protein assembly factor BamE [Hymenobacter cellulosilyticus]